MHLDFRGADKASAYKILTNVVMPRPIAWITSLDVQGGINLAPYSFFNCMGAEPPVVVIGVGNGSDGRPKHTAQNIAATRDFVINLVTEDLVNAMNITAAEFPAGHNEMETAGLRAAESQFIHVPRVADARIALECTLIKIERIGQNNLIIGEVLGIYAADGVIDTRLHVHGFDPIGRLGAPSWYARTTDRFEIHRVKPGDVKRKLETDGNN